MPDKSMDRPLDLKEVALGLLKVAKANLERDGYLTPAAFLVKPGGVDIVGLAFRDAEEKSRAYAEVVRLAKAGGALAIVTLNDARLKKLGSPKEAAEFAARYRPGQLKADPAASECIMLTIYPADGEPWGVVAEYRRAAGGIEFAKETRMGAGEGAGSSLQVGMLEGWGRGARRKPAPC